MWLSIPLVAQSPRLPPLHLLLWVSHTLGLPEPLKTSHNAGINKAKPSTELNTHRVFTPQNSITQRFQRDLTTGTDLFGKKKTNIIFSKKVNHRIIVTYFLHELYNQPYLVLLSTPTRTMGSFLRILPSFESTVGEKKNLWRNWNHQRSNFPKEEYSQAW